MTTVYCLKLIFHETGFLFCFLNSHKLDARLYFIQKRKYHWWWRTGLIKQKSKYTMLTKKIIYYLIAVGCESVIRERTLIRMNTMLEKLYKRNSIEFQICIKRSLKNKLLSFLSEATYKQRNNLHRCQKCEKSNICCIQVFTGTKLSCKIV